MELYESVKPMEAIILAAGYSSRARDFKMDLKLGSTTVLEQTASKFAGICKKVIIVGGYQWERTREAAMKIQEKYAMEITSVFNENFDKGMFSSIQRGCMAVTAPSFFITPGDCPVVSKETIQILVKETGNIVIPSYHYKGGHPIKLASEIKKQILIAKVDSNLREILQAYEKHYVNVEDPGVLMDLDTLDDYKNVIDYYNYIHK